MDRDVSGYLMKNSLFCILNFPFKISLFEKLYQTLVTVFHHIIKNFEVRQKYSARSYFRLSSPWLICDETLCLVFDILLENSNARTKGELHNDSFVYEIMNIFFTSEKGEMFHWQNETTSPKTKIHEINRFRRFSLTSVTLSKVLAPWILDKNGLNKY